MWGGKCFIWSNWTVVGTFVICLSEAFFATRRVVWSNVLKRQPQLTADMQRSSCNITLTYISWDGLWLRLKILRSSLFLLTWGFFPTSLCINLHSRLGIFSCVSVRGNFKTWGLTVLLSLSFWSIYLKIASVTEHWKAFTFCRNPPHYS